MPSQDTGGGFVERLLAGPDDAELTVRELARLKAWLDCPANRPTALELRNGSSEYAKLKRIWDFNRNLQAARAPSTPPTTEKPGEREATGKSGSGTLPTRIWSVEDYYRAKDFYEAHGAIFNPALEAGSPAAYHVFAQAQLRHGEGTHNANSTARPSREDRERGLSAFLRELTSYERAVRNARRREFFPLEAGHPLHDAVDNLGGLPSPEPLGTWLALCDRTQPCKTLNGWRNRQEDVLLKDIPTLRAWAEAELQKCRTSPAETEKTDQRDVDFDRRYMVRAIEEAKKSVFEDDRVHPKVGVVVVKDGKELAVAYRGELDKGEHAEFTALEKKLADVEIAGATIYTTLEPCTTRNHPKLPCAVRLMERKVRRVVIGILDPNPTVSGKGVLKLREANIAVDLFPPDLMSKIEEMNREFMRGRWRASRELGNDHCQGKP